MAERQFMCALEGGCQVPMGAYAVIEEGQMKIHGFVGAVDGSKILRAEIVGASDDYMKIGQALAEKLLTIGARELLDEVRN